MTAETTSISVYKIVCKETTTEIYEIEAISEEQAMDSVNLMPLLKQTHGAEGHRFLMHYSEAESE